jgi:GTPase
MKTNLIDQAEFRVKAGRGGNGSASFRREKYVPRGGPDGGNGGEGGSVILRTNPQLSTLKFYSGKDRFEAPAGQPGGKRRSTGENAGDIVLEVPVGTVVYIKADDYALLQGRSFYGKGFEEIAHSGMKIDSIPYFDFEERWGISKDEIPRQSDSADLEGLAAELGEDEPRWIKVVDMDEEGDEVVLAQGGRGGLGNTVFKSSSMTTPKFAQKGEGGESFMVKLELKVLADVGLVGLPNAGKSTLLSVLSNAKPEIADYPFTTLSPNLGVMEESGKSLVIADIPGLIEGASLGKGLGHEFLRHVERCRVLLYVLAPMEDILEEIDENKVAEYMFKQFMTVKAEVAEYGHDLENKPYVVSVNKLDLLDKDYAAAIGKRFAKEGMDPLFFSAATTEGIEGLRKILRSVS